MTGYSTTEVSSQISEQMQLAVFERNGSLARKTMYVLVAVILICAVFAAIAESDVCAEARGRLEPRTRVQIIRPPTEGTILSYLVHEGQKVKKGQTLIQLNTIRTKSELDKKQQDLAMLEIELQQHENARAGLARIIANPRYNGKGLALPEADRIAGELYTSKNALDLAMFDMSSAAGKTSAPSPDMAVLSSQRNRLESAKTARSASVGSKKEERNSEREKLMVKMQMLVSALSKAEVQLRELESGLADARREMEIYERGKKLGVASEVKFLDVQNYMHEREFRVTDQKQQIVSLEQQIEAARLQLESSTSAYNAEKADLTAEVQAADENLSSVPLTINETIRGLHFKQAAFDVAVFHARARYSKELTDMARILRKMREEQGELLVLNQLLAEKTLRAPVDGTVSGVTHRLRGEVVLRGEDLLTIVPDDRELILRAEINNADVGFVEPGQDARLRIDAFPCEEFGIIKGKVTRVDDYPEEKLEPENKRVSVYRATISPCQSFMKVNGEKVALRPGLAIHADIVLRKRSLLALLYEPLLRLGNY